ncbi:hypothetical protein ACN20G_30050 (plasmid) [Streptomyces sp. BI20]|uniref:hypothetical protein n=1 Tax=Streptomyces sp. BI20 TaxID=3403460 RepID=UPI003C790202
MKILSTHDERSEAVSAMFKHAEALTNMGLTARYGVCVKPAIHGTWRLMLADYEKGEN